MKNNYVSRMLKRINEYISEGEYFLAGQKFLELGRYGIMMENNILVTLCTEMSDMLRNGIGEYNRYVKKGNEDDFQKVLDNVGKLSDYLNKDYKNLKMEDKAALLDLIVKTTYLSEKIQYIVWDYSLGKRTLIRRRDGL